MGSVKLEDWSLIWDRTNRWIQLKGIDGEFEIESSPVESALGPFIVQTGNTLYNLGKPSKNAFDWIVPKDIREEFSKGFPKEWIVKITALQERRVTRHTPKREGPIREKSSILSKANRIGKKLEDALYRGMTEKQKERARKLDRLRALQQQDSFKASSSPEVQKSSRAKKRDEKVKKPAKKAPKRVAARKNSAKIIVSKEKKKIEEKNSSENEKPKKRAKKAETKKEERDPKIEKAAKRKRKNRKEAQNCEEEKEEASPPKKAKVKNAKKTASKKAPKAAKKTPIKAPKEAEILSPSRSASKIPSAPENGLPTPNFKNDKNKTKKAKNKTTQKEQRAHLQRVDELNRVAQQVITPVRKPKSFKSASVTCEKEEDLFSSPKNKEKENHDPFSTPAANRRQNDAFATPAAGAFATPAASSSAGSPSACRFATPGEMDFNSSKKFSKTPSGNISKKKLASRVKANDFVKKQMDENNLETDLFETKKGRKRAKLSKKERIEMSALMPVQENEKDEDETDEYF